jgi:hypothetical protein
MSDKQRSEEYGQYGLCRFPTSVFGTVYYLQLGVPTEGSLSVDAKDKIAGEVGEWVMLFPELCPGWKYTEDQKNIILTNLQAHIPDVLAEQVVQYLH